MAARFVLKKAPSGWAASRRLETRPKWNLATRSRTFLGLMLAVCLRFAEWIRGTALPELQARRATAALALGRLGRDIAGRVEYARLAAPEAFTSARNDLATLGVRFRDVGAATIRSMRDAARWTQCVAIPAVRDSEATRYLRRRRPQAALYGGTVALAVAAGLLIARI